MTDDLDLDFSLLPLDLRPLAPLMPRYAQSDDVIRSQLLADASTTDLQDLVSAAAPHWSAINAFLDSNMDPPGPSQDLALALDSFSQAAMEAAFELDRPGSQS